MRHLFRHKAIDKLHNYNTGNSKMNKVNVYRYSINREGELYFSHVAFNCNMKDAFKAERMFVFDEWQIVWRYVGD